MCLPWYGCALACAQSRRTRLGIVTDFFFVLSQALSEFVPMPVTTFRLPVRIYFEDTDAGGIVYHANYLGYMERARGELLRELGFDQRVMLDGRAPLVVVSKIDITFKRPAKLDDLLEVRTRVRTLRHASIVFEQRIVRGEEVIVESLVRCACVDPSRGVPVQISDNIYQALARVCDTTPSSH